MFHNAMSVFRRPEVLLALAVFACITVSKFTLLVTQEKSKDHTLRSSCESLRQSIVETETERSESSEGCHRPLVPSEEHELISRLTDLHAYCRRSHKCSAADSKYFESAVSADSKKQSNEAKQRCNSVMKERVVSTTRIRPTQKRGKCKFYSQQHEDATVYNLFFSNKKTPGVYLEMGALDGVTYSNTKFFQENFNWSGVLIEPLPSQYQKLAVNRPNDVTINSAVCVKNGFVNFTVSGARSGITKYYSGHRKKSTRGQEVQIPCKRLEHLLPPTLTRIHFWSLDVEGAELDALQSFNWATVKVKVLVIERNGVTDTEIQQLLLRKNFTFVRTQTGNQIWLNPSYDNN